MKRIVLACTIVTIFSFPAFSAELTDPNQDRCQSDATNVIYELVPQVTSSHYRTGDQTIGHLGLSRSNCTNEFNGRWEIEGGFDVVHERGGTSYDGIIGGGPSFQLPHIDDYVTFTPKLYLGYENTYYSGGSATVSGSVLFEYGHDFDKTQEVIFVFNTQPLYSSTHLLANQSIGQSDSAEFSDTTEAGFDFRISDGWRAKAMLADQYVAKNIPANNIASLILSARDAHPVGFDEVYDWNFELWLSKGNDGYRGATFAITRRL